MSLPRLDNNSQLFPLLDGEQGQGDQQRAVQGHLVKVVQGCSRLFTSSSSSRSPGWIIVCQQQQKTEENITLLPSDTVANVSNCEVDDCDRQSKRDTKH